MHDGLHFSRGPWGEVPVLPGGDRLPVIEPLYFLGVVGIVQPQGEEASGRVGAVAVLLINLLPLIILMINMY